MVERNEDHPTPDPGVMARCAAIELLVLDVDGVLTDSSISYDDRGGEIKTFSVRDGAGLAFWHRLGKRSAILTGRSSPIVGRRAGELGMTLVRQGASEKGPELHSILAAAGFRADPGLLIERRLPDLPAAQDRRPGRLPRRCDARGPIGIAPGHEGDGRPGRRPRGHRGDPPGPGPLGRLSRADRGHPFELAPRQESPRRDLPRCPAVPPRVGRERRPGLVPGT
ncbi:MAG: hypothetical protein U0800_15540 [Isosphaeraceae bacterium]